MTEETTQFDRSVEVTVDDGEVAIDDSPEAGIEALRSAMTAAEDARKTAESERDEARRSSDSERQAREEAERRAHAATAEAQNRAVGQFEAQYDSIINAHAAAVSDLNTQKAALKNAMSEGDFEKVADISAEIGVTASKVRQYEEGKVALEAQRKNVPAATAQAPYVNEADQREAFIRGKTARTASWLRRNDRYFTDQRFRDAVGGAHSLAVHRGMPPDSDEYFRFIEEQTGMREAEAAPTPTPVATAASATTARSSPMPSAPPGGSTVSATRPTGGSSTVTLSPQERELCRMTGISEAAYAKQKVQLQADGLIGNGR